MLSCADSLIAFAISSCQFRVSLPPRSFGTMSHPDRVLKKACPCRFQRRLPRPYEDMGVVFAALPKSST
jgi:hypothetical protein